MLQPKKTKYRKFKKGRLQTQASSNLQISKGNFGLKALQSGRISAIQIEAARRTISRKVKRKAKVWINIFPHIGVSKKPSGIRMGKGKGKINYWQSSIGRGKILFEIFGVSEKVASQALLASAKKLSIKTSLVTL
jgi:large subunit ribosomal protein L16